MKERDLLYPEQYELNEKKPGLGQLNRRSFFKYMGSGIASFIVVSDLLAADIFKGLGQEARSIAEDTLAAWIHVNEDGSITVFTGKVEVGQNIRTSLAQIVAEELFVPLDTINLIMGDTRLTPYDRGTYGSLTTPQMGPILRKAAASLREVMKETALKEWGLTQASLNIQNGQVQDPSTGKKLSFAALAKGKELLQKVNQDVQVIAPDQWKIAGTSVPKVNSQDFLTGKHKYVSDMKLPGMVYGKILRPPALGATLVSIDVSKAAAVPEVQVVQEGDFIGVTVPSIQTANIALALMDAEWKIAAQPSQKELVRYLKDQAEDKEPNQQADQVFEDSVKKIEQTFSLDYIAHVPLEPRAGLAQWQGDELTVWTGTQRPFGVQEELERAFKMPKEKIRVIMPDTGSGYGGKHTGEAGIEAARLAKAVGKPVKVLWTREEEFKWAYSRPAGVMEVKCSLDNQGQINSWQFHNYNSGSAGIESPYRMGVKHSKFIGSKSPLRQGSYRALASTANIFAIESTMDDLAQMQQMEPLQFRLQHLDDERLSDVLKATAKAFNWEATKKSQHGYGLACGAVKGGFVATCAEVEVHPSSREVKVLRLTVGFECGAIINPLHLKGQVIGCVLQGLGGALFEAVDFRNGEILNPSLSTYRVPRFKDVPELEVVLLNRKDLPSSGAGEAPIVAVAPAIRNAILDATGVKLYHLPMLPNGTLPTEG
jgi:nicotinate dehydrogenase subunit B